MFRAALVLFDKWGLTDEQAATLLDLAPRSYKRWKASVPGRIDRDGKARSLQPVGHPQGAPHCLP